MHRTNNRAASSGTPMKDALAPMKDALAEIPVRFF
jgi:hypothetical protein